MSDGSLVERFKKWTEGQRGPLLSSMFTSHPLAAGAGAAAGEYLENDKDDKFSRAAAMAGGGALANAVAAPVAKIVANAVLQSTGLSGNAGNLVKAIITDVIPSTAQYGVISGIRNYMKTSAEKCMCKEGKHNPKCPVCSKSQKYLDSHHKLNPEAKVAFVGKMLSNPALRSFAADAAKSAIVPGLATMGADMLAGDSFGDAAKKGLMAGGIAGLGMAGHRAGMAGTGEMAKKYQGLVGQAQQGMSDLGQKIQQGATNLMTPAPEAPKTGAYLLAYEKEAAHAAGVSDAVDAFLLKTSGMGKAIGTGLQTVGKALGTTTTGLGNAAGAVVGGIGGAIEGLSQGQGMKGALAHGAKGAITGALPAGTGFIADAVATPLVNKALGPTPAPGAPA